MIIGSGMLARAFAPHVAASENECVYAAGVSNSTCEDPREFLREAARLEAAINRHRSSALFLYFGTCAANARGVHSPYVAHKIEMERLAARHQRCLILRLPQVAGRTENPHTLLNYIFSRVSRSERFRVWTRARRNIIDLDDVVRMALALARDGVRGERLDVANTSDVAISEVVEVMAEVVGKAAVCDYVDRGDIHPVDAGHISALAERCGISFGTGYLERVIRKYYHPVWTGAEV